MDFTSKSANTLLVALSELGLSFSFTESMWLDPSFVIHKNHVRCLGESVEFSASHQTSILEARGWATMKNIFNRLLSASDAGGPWNTYWDTLD